MEDQCKDRRSYSSLVYMYKFFFVYIEFRKMIILYLILITSFILHHLATCWYANNLSRLITDILFLQSIVDNAMSFFFVLGSCNLNESLCENGRCINSSSVCNYYNDCGDNSDEFGCRKFVLCIPHRIDAARTEHVGLFFSTLRNPCNKLFNTLHKSSCI